MPRRSRCWPTRCVRGCSPGCGRSGSATATELAAELSTNTGATSYHLRKLESVGLVTDTGEGEGKRRLWRASTQYHSWTNAGVPGR